MTKGRGQSWGRLELKGQKFGRLKVLRYAGTDGQHSLWRCKCECGKRLTTQGKRLKSGYTKSCGCYRADPVVRQAARWKLTPERRRAIAVQGGEASKNQATLAQGKLSAEKTTKAARKNAKLRGWPAGKPRSKAPR